MSRDHEYGPLGDNDAESSNTKPAQYKRYGIVSRSEWLLELGSLAASLALFVGIIIIFLNINNKPRSDWTFFISLNSVVSVLTTLCSALMMHGVSEFIGQLKWLHFKSRPRKLVNFEKFDEASRGPMGSFKFLYGVRLNLATVGALVTIARLAFSPLAQEVIDYPERMITKADDRATFGYAHEYNRNLSGAMFNHKMSAVPHDSKMQSAILQGLYNISSPQDFTCPGSCEWSESYISLGFKTTCENVTITTLRTEKCVKPSSGVITFCNLTTPGGIRLSTQHVDTDSQTTFRFNASSTMDETAQKLPRDFPDLVRFAVYRATSDGNFNPTNINVTECALSLTAYEYSKGHANGSEFGFGSKKEISLPHKRWNIDGGMGGFNGSVWTNASKADGLPELTLGWVDIKALQFYFQSEMISAEWVDGNYDNVNPGISAALIGGVDLEQRFTMMSTSMTDYLRAGPNHKIAKGNRVQMVTYVSIRWPWLIGPAVIEITAVLFAIITIVRNRRSRGVPLWKSSALAVLACRHEKGVGDEVDWIRSDVKDIKKIEETAEHTSVRLE
ncbi:hypothetical protein FDECE_6122 [Fusarium decemcellulare]|nr:hypothetical protein FDECE_6122 [Fusarium decemcellulare]